MNFTKRVFLSKSFYEWDKLRAIKIIPWFSSTKRRQLTPHSLVSIITLSLEHELSILTLKNINQQMIQTFVSKINQYTGQTGIEGIELGDESWL